MSMDSMFGYYFSLAIRSFKRNKVLTALMILAIALGIALVALDPPKLLFAIFCIYGLSGYAIYGWRRLKGKRASVIATSTDDPDEQGLHR